MANYKIRKTQNVGVVIRKMNLSDAWDIAQMWEFFSEVRYNTVPDIDAWLALEMGLFQDPSYVCLVAEEDEKIVGFVDGQFKYEPAFSEVHLIARHSWVDEGRRGEGIGLKLYRKFYDVAASGGASKIIISSPPEGGPAKAILKKLFDQEIKQHTINWVFEV